MDRPILWKHKDSLFSCYTDTSSNGDFCVETIMEKKPDGTIVIVSVNIIPKEKDDTDLNKKNPPFDILVNNQ